MCVAALDNTKFCHDQMSLKAASATETKRVRFRYLRNILYYNDYLHVVLITWIMENEIKICSADNTYSNNMVFSTCTENRDEKANNLPHLTLQIVSVM